MRETRRGVGVIGLTIAIFLATAIGVFAGNPSGPGTPPNATSSHGLDDIYDRLDVGTAGTQSTFTEPAAGPGTGTMHTLNEIMAVAPAADNASGALSANVQTGKTFWGLNQGSGQWGPQTGTLVAAAGGNPDVACWDNTNRYVDCGNGTVNDTVTSLLWLKNANCFGLRDYANANQDAAGLADGACGLTDGSTAGDWRLPTKTEWEDTIARGAALNCDFSVLGDISLTNTPGTGCYGAGPQPFTGVQANAYWSSVAGESFPSNAWNASLYVGVVGANGKTDTNYVWPVRDGQ